MSDKILKLNERELKVLIHLLSQLEKRIYFLRVSLYGETKSYFSSGVPVIHEVIGKENDYFRTTYNLSADDYKLMIDSCEIETCIRRILHEMENFQTFKSLKDVIIEFENESLTFKKHQKMIQAKGKQIEQLKEMLSQEQSQVNVQPLSTKTLDIRKEALNTMEPFCEIEFLTKLKDHKVESRKKYYDYKQDEFKERIEWFKREARMQGYADVQTLSFWLLKYDAYSEKLDNMLKEMFDNLAEKHREYAILKKFRKLNLERIQKFHKLILEREDYIEKYRVRKDKEQREREEELRRQYAAVKIQAYWRGTMVRKHLGPYKIKKTSKKGKKGKGKKKK